MGQITGSVTGMGKAAKHLNTPVVSGNVSLYNETEGQAINPAPVIGMIGVIENVADSVGMAAPQDADLVVIGQSSDCSDGWLGVSVYADILTENPEASPPPVDLDHEAKHGDFVRNQIAAKTIVTAHDISDGGLLAAIADMAVAGDVGADINMPEGAGHGWAFGEDQGRYVVATNNLTALTTAAQDNGVEIQHIGTTNASGELKLSTGDLISVKEIRDAFENWLPDLMSGKS